MENLRRRGIDPRKADNKEIQFTTLAVYRGKVHLVACRNVQAREAMDTTARLGTDSLIETKLQDDELLELLAGDSTKLRELLGLPPVTEEGSHGS